MMKLLLLLLCSLPKMYDHFKETLSYIRETLFIEEAALNLKKLNEKFDFKVSNTRDDPVARGYCLTMITEEKL